MENDRYVRNAMNTASKIHYFPVANILCYERERERERERESSNCSNQHHTAQAISRARHRTEQYNHTQFLHQMTTTSNFNNFLATKGTKISTITFRHYNNSSCLFVFQAPQILPWLAVYHQLLLTITTCHQLSTLQWTHPHGHPQDKSSSGRRRAPKLSVSKPPEQHASLT